MNAITYATAQILRVLPRTRITRVMGRLSDYAWPDRVGKAVVNLYCRAYDVDLDECRKASGFRSFDEFFTRELRDGACGLFNGVLGPDYNAAHRDHFHLDNGPFRICR